MQKKFPKNRHVMNDLDYKPQQLLSIFDSIDEPIYISDPDSYELLFANRALKAIRGDVTCGKCYRVLHKLDSPCPFCTNGFIFGKKAGAAYKWEFKNKATGSTHHCIDTAIRWPDGRMLRCALAIDITKHIRTEEKLRKHKHELMEQINRQCRLYYISQLIQKPGMTIEETLQAIVDLIPSLMRCPETTCAKIVLKKNEFQTAIFKKTKWGQSTPIKLHGAKTGIVQVFCMEEKPASDGGPFLEEEIKSINAIADRVGRIIERIQFEETLLEYKNVIEGSKDFIFTVDRQYRYLFANKAYLNLRNLKSEEVVGYTIKKVVGKSLFKNTLKEGLDKCFAENEIVIDQTSITYADNSKRDLEIRYEPVERNGSVNRVAITARDITKQNIAKNKLKKKEKDLREKTKRLEEVNIALRVLLQQRNEDRAELGENMILNIKELVTPYVDKLKAGGLDPRQETLTEIIESNLANIISPFIGRLTSKYYNLTPMEIRVATLVKDGKTNKDMARLLNLSKSTILTHRHHIRKKLGLKNKKINLRSHLLSLQ